MAYGVRPILSLGMAVLLAGCAGSLADIESRERLGALYAGFPPVFADPALSAYRARYLADKAAFDQAPDTFSGPSPAAAACQLDARMARTLAATSFRASIPERSPAWVDYMAKQGQGYASETVDAVRVSVLDGSCPAGMLQGPAQVLMRYVYVFRQADDPQAYMVHEVAVREHCHYQDGRRNGECVRYSQRRSWRGRMVDGRLMHMEYALAAIVPGASTPQAGTEHYTYTTVFDYGQYRNGIEAGPGVAFETVPIDEGDLLENHTLTRKMLPDGRVAYDEYYGGTHKLRYVLRDGIAHGELVYSPGQLPADGDSRICFQDGAASLTTQCPS